ncbi:MAG: DNA repair protein RecN [Lachnospiraceae bacterium]|nr:DNA repair protein RecN [Lachnospiraceae bacterium]
MLLELQVKNLALIEQAQVEFGGGLNILTGETGAGKSIIIGSVNMALGGKASRDSIRQGADSAYIELLFSVDTPAQEEALKALDIQPGEDGTVIISRKITPSRSTAKINDETVTAARLKQVTSLLMDIHGQHEHQSLLNIHKHLEILDAYAKSQVSPVKEEIRREYHRYRQVKERLSSMEGGQEERLREADFCRFEIESIEQAALKEGEEEELTARYRKLSHAQKIMEGLSEAKEALDEEGIARAVRAVDQVSGFDKELKTIKDQIFDVEALVNELGHAITGYMEGCSYDEGEFRQIEGRLDVIHGFQAKYGSTIARILEVLEEKRKRLEELEHFEEIRAELEKELETSANLLEGFCTKLSQIRKKAGKELAERMKSSLIDLNFLDVTFVMEFRRLKGYTADGFDEAEFLISTNPGQPVKPLRAVASGGELSRIMLAIKTVLADTDEIPTLIFDEIDTGISGRTAQMVSEKLNEIAKSHQVICITHLPQIASMADSHFEIAKSVQRGKTVTNIRRLEKEESIHELARLLGGAQITDVVRQNAREMKELAERTK